MSREEVLSRLNELTSYNSFGRILGILELRENTNLFPNNTMSNEYRLINQEISFLAGLWMHNIDLNKKNWEITHDDKIVEEIYILMNKFHKTYKININTPYNEQLKEIAFYEGDEGYDWQFIQFVQPKYIDFFKWLNEKQNYDIDFVSRTYYHVKNFISEQINRIERQKQKTKEYIPAINAYTISEKNFKKNFSDKEQYIINCLAFKLGVDDGLKIEDIGDDNSFNYKPIILLPNGGYLIINFLNLSIAMNELPFHWIMRSESFKKEYIGDLRGKTAERIVYSILKQKYEGCDIHLGQLIKKTKSANILTDIDILLVYKESAVVFQIKSKRLTYMSKQGDYDAINKDFTEAIADAYGQGVICINCLENYTGYYSLKKIQAMSNVSSIYNICITLDQYPTISSISYIKSAEIEQNQIPLVAMSIYDLDAISLLFSLNDFFDYVRFRTQCSLNKIYGISEMYFIGAYLGYRLFSKTFAPQIQLEHKYAKLADYIVTKCHNDNIKIQSIQDIYKIICDNRTLDI